MTFNHFVKFFSFGLDFHYFLELGFGSIKNEAAKNEQKKTKQFYTDNFRDSRKLILKKKKNKHA